VPQRQPRLSQPPSARVQPSAVPQVSHETEAAWRDLSPMPALGRSAVDRDDLRVGLGGTGDLEPSGRGYRAPTGPRFLHLAERVGQESQRPRHVADRPAVLGRV
jgi:hypothetical protein